MNSVHCALSPVLNPFLDVFTPLKEVPEFSAMYLPQAIGQNWFPGRNHEYYYYLLSSLFLFSMEPHVAQAGLELLIQLFLLLDSWSAGVRVHLCLGVCM